MFYSAADFSSWFRLKSKSCEIFDVIGSTKYFPNFFFGVVGCSQTPPPALGVKFWWYVGKFIPYSVLRRAHSVVQSEFSPECDLVLLRSVSSILSSSGSCLCLLPRPPVTFTIYSVCPSMTCFEGSSQATRVQYIYIWTGKNLSTFRRNVTFKIRGKYPSFFNSFFLKIKAVRCF